MHFALHPMKEPSQLNFILSEVACGLTLDNHVSVLLMVHHTNNTIFYKILVRWIEYYGI